MKSLEIKKILIKIFTNQSVSIAHAKIIADAQGKELLYEMVDFHSSRPGHDLRYALSGDKMKNLGWVPSKSVRERINQVTKWTVDNERWIKL